MRYLPMRRSKLTSSEGPGSLVINPDGETLLVGALDHWFQQPDENDSPKLDEEFLVREPRLSNLLQVDALYQPPDYRQPKRQAEMSLANMNLVIPLYRFPTWHYCSKCQTLKKFKLDSTSVYTNCSTCDNEKRFFKQVPFVTICNEGHINEFPWIEWVHKNDKATCGGTLTLKMSGGTTLDTWQLNCSCGAKRRLSGITGIIQTKEGLTKTSLSQNLNEHSSMYYCPGNRPWCGTLDEEQEKGSCSEMPLAILRNSINVYMPKKISALHVPAELSDHEEKVIKALQEPNGFWDAIKMFQNNDEQALSLMKKLLRNYVSKDVTDEEYLNAFHFLLTLEEKEVGESTPINNTIKDDEFEKLTTNIILNKSDLVVEPIWRNTNEETEAQHPYKPYLKRLSKVNRLKETTVLYGFDRKDSKITEDFQHYIENLYKDSSAQTPLWLPASITYGEGIFIEFNKEVLQQWEESKEVQRYFNKYLKRVAHVSHRDEKIIASPRNIMIHTMSHFLIEQFGEVSGYTASSIRERLYLEPHQSGVLIYTASGDSEGTFGGLVKLANEQEFFRYFDIAISKAQWCSSDPVCTELGKEHGQGIDTLNGAACYNCSHAPETSCEYINRYLDRTLLIDPTIGFFQFLRQLT